MNILSPKSFGHLTNPTVVTFHTVKNVLVFKVLAVIYFIYLVWNNMQTTASNHSQQLQRVQGVLSHQEDHEGPKREKQGKDENISCIDYIVSDIR